MFSVNTEGIVSLTIDTGTISDADYDDGHDFGLVSSLTIRRNEIEVTVPSDYSNSGDTVSDTLIDFQSRSSLPSVTTNTVADTSTTILELSGRINSTGGLTILDSGFYIIEGTGYGVSSIVTFGHYIRDGRTTVGTFTEDADGLDQDTRYSYVAFARNELGTGYGQIRTAETDQGPAVAMWLRGAVGACGGATVTSSTLHSVGEWEGASNIIFDASDEPESASCEASQEMCEIRRSRTYRNRYSGGTRDVDYTCDITTEGTGNPTCAANEDIGLPVGNVDDVEPIEENCPAYFLNELGDPEVIEVPNDAFDVGDDFTEEAISVTDCAINQQGNSASVTTNYGTATVTNLSSISSNTTSEARLVTLRYSVVVDSSELNEDDWIIEQDEYEFTGLTTECSQPGITISFPTFTANSAEITAFDGTDGRIGDGETLALEGSGGTYRITAPTGSGGTVVTGSSSNGAGNFTIGAGDEREHSFSIRNSLGRASYSFIIETSV